MTDQTRPDAGLPGRKAATQGRARERRGGKARAQPGAEHGAGRFESALCAARLYVFSQDKTLQHTRIHSPRDAQMLPEPDGEDILAIKRQVLESGKPQNVEAFYAMPEGRALFAIDIDPTFGPDGAVDGITCRAIDVTGIRSLEREQQRLTAELGTTLQRYETALRGSNVTVFTHDRDLRYTSISNPLFGRDVREIVGYID